MFCQCMCRLWGAGAGAGRAGVIITKYSGNVETGEILTSYDYLGPLTSSWCQIVTQNSPGDSSGTNYQSQGGPGTNGSSIDLQESRRPRC